MCFIIFKHLSKLNNSLTGIKKFCTCNILNKSLYQDLGVSSNATQTDIKNAYYKLSKLHHPDKNKGSIKSSEKFQHISKAYEILGNVKFRRLYDKGLIQTNYDWIPPFETVEQNSTSNRNAYPPKYNFDDWINMHYSSTFKRRNNAREKWEEKQRRLYNDRVDIMHERILVSMFTFMLIMILISYADVCGSRS